MYTYQYPRVANSVDVVLIKDLTSGGQLLLIRRGNDPFKGKFALPGGFIDVDESLESAALRELEEETGIGGIKLTQIHTFSAPDRDPRGRIISTAYGAILDEKNDYQPEPDSDATQACWVYLSELPPLAFDHFTIIETALKKFGLNLPRK